VPEIPLVSSKIMSSLNEVSLADKIAAIMSGSFLPPAVPAKKKKDKNKVTSHLHNRIKYYVSSSLLPDSQKSFLIT